MAQETKPHIVIVEDDQALAAMVEQELEGASMRVQAFHDAESGLNYIRRNFANLVLLDVSLPNKSGFELLENMQDENIQIPVIFLTGNDAETDVVRGLSLGGEDYVLKPFSFPELIARIRAVLRRTDRASDYNVTQNACLSAEPFTFCGAEVLPKTLELVFPNGVRHQLGRKEFGIIVFLSNNPGVVLTRGNIIHAVWGMHADVKSRSLDQYIVKIRDIFSKNELPLKHLRTVHGVGYVYEPEGSGD